MTINEFFIPCQRMQATAEFKSMVKKKCKHSSFPTEKHLIGIENACKIIGKAESVVLATGLSFLYSPPVGLNLNTW